MFSGRYSLCRSCNARSPSERKINGLVPFGLRRTTSSASQRNNATLPTNNSARTRLFCGLGRRLRGLLPHDFVDHLVGGTHKRIDRVHRTHRRHFLLVGLLALASALVRQGWKRGLGRLLGGQGLNAPREPLCSRPSLPGSVPLRSVRAPGDCSWYGSTSQACSRLRSSDALTAISKPKIVSSFRTASA